jgi:hypothetical protein
MTIKSITWKDTFNCEKVFPEPLYKCREIAKSVGYNFLCFNTLVYTLQGERIGTEEELEKEGILAYLSDEGKWLKAESETEKPKKVKEGHYVFYDRQTGGYSAHTTIEGLSDMHIDEWLEMVRNSEDYEGEYQDEQEKWRNATESMRRKMIDNADYDILKPTPETIRAYEGYHDTIYNGWEEEGEA